MLQSHRFWGNPAGLAALGGVFSEPVGNLLRDENHLMLSAAFRLLQRQLSVLEVIGCELGTSPIRIPPLAINSRTSRFRILLDRKMISSTASFSMMFQLVNGLTFFVLEIGAGAEVARLEIVAR